jgi:hypothetical protein
VPDIWIGLLLSIPVGLAINLVSVPLATKLSQRTQKSAERRNVRDAVFAERVLGYSQDRPSLYNYLLETLIRIAWFGALFGVISGFFALIGYLSFGYGFFNQLLFAGSQLVALLGAIIVLNIAREALTILRQVRAAD